MSLVEMREKNEMKLETYLSKISALSEISEENINGIRGYHEKITSTLKEN